MLQKNDIQVDTLRRKNWDYYLKVKKKKNNGTYTVLMLNFVSEIAYEASSKDESTILSYLGHFSNFSFFFIQNDKNRLS